MLVYELITLHSKQLPYDQGNCIACNKYFWLHNSGLWWRIEIESAVASKDEVSDFERLDLTMCNIVNDCLGLMGYSKLIRCCNMEMLMFLTVSLYNEAAGCFLTRIHSCRDVRPMYLTLQVQLNG